MLGWLLFQFYRWLLFPLALGLTYLLKPFLPQKIQQTIEDRKAKALPLLPARPIWIHASSGEIEYAKPLLRELKSRWPQLPILVTYFSPSAKSFRSSLPEVDLFLPLPWDQRQKIAGFVRHFQPIAVMFARGDVWPELSYQLYKRKIPSLLFSATRSASSWPAPLKKFALDKLSLISCVAAADQVAYQLLTHAPTEVGGDTRFDQVTYRLTHPKAIKALKQHQDFTLIAGSTWPEDDAVLLTALLGFLQNKGRLILAPHEVSSEHLTQIQKQLKQNNIGWDLYSEAHQWTQPVLLVDVVGILPELYTWGDIAFVGGSFKAKVHSVMEPLAAGLPVIVGPYHLNNREAISFQNLSLKNGLRSVEVVHTPGELTQLLQRWQQLAKGQDLKHQLHQAIGSQLGATQRVVQWTEQALASASGR